MDAPSVAAPSDRAAERDLADLWLILWHGRWLVAAITMAAVALAFAYSLATPSLYTSSAQVLVDPRDRQVLARGITPDTQSPDGGIAQVESQTRVLQSDVVLLRAVRAAGLAADDEFGAAPAGLLGRLRQVLGNSPVEAETAELRALRLLKRRLIVKRADKVFVIDIAAQSRDAEKAARIAEAVAQAYLDDQAQARDTVANTVSGELTSRLAELQTQVRNAENAVEAFKTAHDIVGAGGRLVKEQQLTDTNNQLVVAQARRLDARARVETIDRARKAGAAGAATADALQSPNMLQLRAQYAQIARQKADLDSQLGARHPAITAIDAQANDVKRLIASEIDRIARAARSDLDQAEVTTRGLQRAVEDLSRTAQTTSQDYVRLRELERQADATRAVYEAYLVRARETAEQAGINTVNARIITHAVAPIEKSWPPTLLLLLAACGGGLGIGAGAAFVRAHLAPIVLSQAQVRQIGDLPVVSVGPAPRLLDDDIGRNVDVGELAAPNQAALAPLRRLLADRAAPGRPAVLTLAAVPGDDVLRTRLARALAASAALEGTRVLLLDGDFTKWRLSKLTGDARRAGLLDLLRGRRVLEQVVSEDTETGVVLMGAGLGDSIARPIARADLDGLFDRLGTRFDAVVIDAGDPATDIRAASLHAAADESLVLACAGRTSGLALRDMVERAGAVGRPFSGVVFLHADRRA